MHRLAIVPLRFVDGIAGRKLVTRKIDVARSHQRERSTVAIPAEANDPNWTFFERSLQARNLRQLARGGERDP